MLRQFIVGPYSLCQPGHGVAALPIRVFSSESRERVSEMVEPRYTKSWTTSSLWSEIVLLGGEFTSSPITDGESEISAGLAKAVRELLEALS